MATTALITIKNWFKTNLKPTQEQFWAWMDSFWHKGEKIPITSIDDIENILNAKADAEALTNHVVDDNAHEGLFVKTKIYANGELQIFKVAGNGNNSTIEAGDYCIGFVAGQFISANYIGGNVTLLASFDI